jgi:hypothetical protein
MQAALVPLSRAVGLKIGRDPFASGPHALIFAHFVPYFVDIPCTSHFTVFGVRFSNKVFVYLAGVQLLLSHGWKSAVPALCGLMVGPPRRATHRVARPSFRECRDDIL